MHKTTVETNNRGSREERDQIARLRVQLANYNPFSISCCHRSVPDPRARGLAKMTLIPDYYISTETVHLVRAGKANFACSFIRITCSINIS